MSFKSLENKIIFIAGAGRIGSAIAEAVREAGGLAVLGDLAQETRILMISSPQEAGGAGGTQSHPALSSSSSFFKNENILQLDITDKKNLRATIAELVKKYGQIDGFINATYPRTAHFGRNDFLDLDFDDLAANLSLHLGGFILAACEFVRFFRQQGWGNIINLSSIFSLRAPRFENYAGTAMSTPVEYAAIKAGINQLTVWLAKACFGQKIRVNAIASGGILDGQPASFLEKYRAGCASKGMLAAGDLAGAVVFLLGEGSEFITGQVLVVDDGWSL